MRHVVHCAVLLLASLACATAAHAGKKHQLLGTWSVDVSKISQPNPPRSVTLVLEEAGEGRYRMTVEIEDSDGVKTSAGGSSFKPDGTALRVEGSLDVDIVSVTMPNSRTLVMAGGFMGKPASSRVWTLSDDGKEMVEVAMRHLPDGTPYLRVFSWKRKFG